MFIFHHMNKLHKIFKIEILFYIVKYFTALLFLL